MRWLQATAQATIACPEDQVFAFVSAVENMERWVTGVSDVRRPTDAALAAGATFSSTYTYARRTHEIEYEVTAVEAPRVIAMQSLRGPFPFQSTLALAPVPEGTLVRNELRAGSDSAFTSATFVLLRPLLRALMRRRLRKELRVLKALLEDASPPDG